MKRITLMMMLLLSSFILMSQNKGKKFDVQAIKNDTLYYYGESAVFETEEEAVEASLKNLFQNIANNCRPNAIYGGTEDQKSQLNKIISTFEMRINEKVSQHPLVYDFENDRYSYFVYLSRSDFREMCNLRKNSIERYAKRGFNTEEDENLQLEDALKSYYWGMMLCVAHPYGNSLKITVNEEKVDAYYWFHERLQATLGSFAFKVPKENAIVEKDDGLMLDLNVYSTKGFPVSNLKFLYNNGNKYVPTSVADGKAVVLLKDVERTNFNIKIDYEFKLEATVDPEVKKVLDNIDHNIKLNNKHVINIEPYLAKTLKEDNIAVGTVTDMAPLNAGGVRIESIDTTFNVEKTDYLNIIQKVEMALRKKDYESIRCYFTEEGFGMLDTLSRYGNMTVVGKQEYSFLKISDMVICRGINMQFDFRNNASFNRDVVFRFNDNSKKIESIAFRLSSVTETDIVKKSKWSKESRLALINFLEDYQTAYALKRLDYLESIYSDDALIVVGHVLKKTVIPDRAQFNISENEVKLMQYDKNTYFQNLTRTFKSQEYINLRFAETDFTKARTSTKREVYGVRLLQEYYSATYGDIGYLFLLVDLTDEKPLIHVRAWQPDEVELSKLMGMKDLRL